MAGGVEYQVTKVDPTSPQTKGMVHQVHKVSEEIAATIGGKVYRARIINDPTAPTVAGKVYQIVLIDDPDDPSVKGMVYNAILTGGSEAVVVGPAISPLLLPDAIADSLTYVKAFGGTEQRSLPQGYQQLVSLTTDNASYFDADYIINSFDVDVTTDAVMTFLTSGPNMLWGFMGAGGNLPRWGIGSYQGNWLYGANATQSSSFVTLDTNRHVTVGKMYYSGGNPVYSITVDGVTSSALQVSNVEIMEENTLSTFIGARNNRGTAGNFNPSTFYSFKIEKAGELVVNMVPAKRLSDNVVGFYDTVRDRFFVNAGTGTITAGDAAVPTPDYPIDIVSNNGVLKVNSQGQIYTDGTVETIEDAIGNTATAEMLLKVGNYQDEQEILSGAVTRNVGVLVLDGVTTGKMFSSAWNATYKRCNLTISDMLISVAATEDAICNFFPYSSSVNTSPTSLGFCTNNGYLLVSFIGMENITSANDANTWLAAQYNAGTPVIVLYPLATETTESVTGQTLQVQAGDNTLEITQASLAGLELEAEYEKEGA